MRFSRTILIVYLVFVAADLSAALRIERGQTTTNIGLHLEYYEDPGGDLSLADVRETPVEWTANGKKYVNFGYSSSAFWFRFKLDNPLPTNRRVFFELDFSTGDFIHLYIVKKGGTIETRSTGDHLPFHHRELDDRNFVFSLDLAPGLNTFFLRIQSTSSIRFHPLIMSPEGFLERLNRDITIIWLYYGWMLLVLLHSFFNFIITKEKAYLYFSIFTLVFLVEEMINMGYAYRYLWPNSVWLANNAILYTLSITQMFAGLFVLSYLDAKRLYPRINRFILAISVVPALLYLPLTLVVTFQQLLSIILINILIVATVQVVVVLYALTKKDRAAIYLGIGSCMVAMAVIVSISTYSGLLPLTLFTKWVLQLAFALQMLTSSLGLADKINTMKNALKTSEEKLSKSYVNLKNANQNLASINKEMSCKNRELVSTYDALENSEQRFRAIMEQAPLSIEVFDPEGFLVQANPNRERPWGPYTASDDRPFNILTDERISGSPLGPLLEKGFGGDAPIMEEWSFQAPGTELEKDTSYLRSTIYPLKSPQGKLENIVVFHEDITEKKQTEKMMIQTDKMISLGGLAAGIAHEINNPLAAVIQNIQLALNRTVKDIPANRKAAEKLDVDLETIRRYLEARNIPQILEMIDTAGKRAAEIIINMLTFSRKSDTEPSVHNVADLLDRTVALSENDYDLRKKYDFKTIRIVRDYDDALPGVLCQAGMIQQVFLNILKNGAQAMIRSSGDTGRPPVFKLAVKAEDAAIRIEIEDNGPGMDEETQKRIFQPFFTTKPAEEGTGIGLYVSYFIITDNHQGSLEVESDQGVGTRFVIRLPSNA
ncbi:MAG: hypothetical protein GY866_10630 [Proteobacteria bacterium]|nr:hypothetical protein [Pseudomonadota bacterium]